MTSDALKSRHSVPAIVGLLVFLAFVAIGGYRFHRQSILTHNWVETTATVVSISNPCAPAQLSTEDSEQPAGKGQASSRAESPVQDCSAGGTRERIELDYEAGGNRRRAALPFNAHVAAAVAPGTIVAILVDPKNPERVMLADASAHQRAFLWTSAFGAVLGLITALFGSFSSARSEPVGSPVSESNGNGASAMPLSARVASGFGLSVLVIGSLFAASAFVQALWSGNNTGMQGALVIFAIAFGLWRVCRWLAERLFS